MSESVPASVVICSRERQGLLRDTVASILAGAKVPEELVLVDQSATPDTMLAELAGPRGCAVRYLQSDTTGLSRARNVGLRMATRDVAVLVDDDMFVEPDWLETLVGARRGGSLGVATGNVLPAPDEGAGGTVPPAALVERGAATYRGVQAIDVVPGANVALPRATVLELGGYDERLGAGTRFAAADDNDIGHRLLLAGCEVRHVPDAVVLHRAWRARSEIVRLRFRYGRGKGAFYAKHASLRDRHILRRAAGEAGGRIRRALRALPDDPKRSASELISLAGLISGALDWLLTVRIPGALGRRP